jgi:hypothetical protein
VTSGVEVGAELTVGVITQKNESNAPVEAVSVGFFGVEHAVSAQAYLPQLLYTSAPSVTTVVVPALK